MGGMDCHPSAVLSKRETGSSDAWGGSNVADVSFAELPLISPASVDDNEYDGTGIGIVPAVNQRCMRVISVTVGGSPITTDTKEPTYYDYMTGAFDLYAWM